jgi:hypothetical protein
MPLAGVDAALRKLIGLLIEFVAETISYPLPPPSYFYSFVRNLKKIFLWMLKKDF